MILVRSKDNQATSAEIRIEGAKGGSEPLKVVGQAGWLTASCATISVTGRSPVRNMSRMRRRLGSAKTSNVATTSANMPHRLYNRQGIYWAAAGIAR